MHRLAAIPGGWNPDSEGVIFVEQTPAPLVMLTAADTDIQAIAQARLQLPINFPALRVANLLHLQQQLTIDTYAETVLEQAQVIVLRILGGRAYWSYGLDVVQELVDRTGKSLILLPGDDRPDPELVSHSTVPLAIADRLWRYLTEGGVRNWVHALQFIADRCLGTAYHPPVPQTIPRVGLYAYAPPHSVRGTPLLEGEGLGVRAAKVGLLFYRAHYLSGNLAAIDALCAALIERQLEPVPVFVASLREPDIPAELLNWFQPKDQPGIQVLLNTTSFSLARLQTETPDVELWQTLDVPVLQVICSGGTLDQWQTQWRGLSPRDLAMNVALPEVDGRLITRAVSFKVVRTWNPELETDVVGYEPVDDRVQFVADLAANWVRLRQTPVSQRRIALVLANYPTRDGRLANGVGLDTPASCVAILKAMQQAGYQVEHLPQIGDELIQRLTAGITNDPEGQDLRPVHQYLSETDYQAYFATLPIAVQQGVSDRWGDSPSPPAPLPKLGEGRQGLAGGFPIPGIQLGNVFVGIQPSRGYDLDPALNYHAPDLEPTPAYLAFYQWLRTQFGAQAIVHVGKHGNLEWLPGKSIALSEACYPEVALGSLPHLYPFIVNDPGEGAQAKRRAQAVILDHLTPPMTRAELYGPLQQLEALIDEYYEAQSLDPTRLPIIRDRIQGLVAQECLQHELEQGRRQKVATDGLGSGRQQPLKGKRIGQKVESADSSDSWMQSPDPWVEFLACADGYLCELKEAQIRDGLHIFGQCPQGRQLRDLIVAIARHPGSGRLGLIRAIAEDWGLDFDPFTADMDAPLSDMDRQCLLAHQTGFERWDEGEPPPWGQHPHTPIPQFGKSLENQTYRIVGDAIELLEQQAATLVEQILPLSPSLPLGEGLGVRASGTSTQRELHWIKSHLLPALQQTDREIQNLLQGLGGGYVASGASGAPTRGRPDVLPTGRNFYAVDIRAIPTESAWAVGRKAAEALIERYTQEHGEYPKTLGLSIWGTSTMRTGGDDLAEALALLGVQPIWDGPSRRVVDFEIVPVSALGRPRVDVTLRISGFFRDAFANLIDLFDQAVQAVAALEEPADQNPLADQVQRDIQQWRSAGLPDPQAIARSTYRIFGSKPGAYGAGLQGLIEAQNWTDAQDLARAYINWSCYAYTSGQARDQGVSAPEAFEQRLQHLQVVLQNQDNREHDLLDSDDYYQFQGGMTVAARALQGHNPQVYVGDHAIPENPKVRSLRQAIARVYRSRVINPKWIAGVMRHGYKGAFEMAATVDYLFAYDATTQCVDDFMYQGVAEAYVLDPIVQDFVQQHNPWALRDMAERLLEAHQRRLWQGSDPQTLEALRAIVHQAEGEVEGRSGSI
jgi:cobaltochelatase CobN